jgi:CTP:molybdopterin cytidylyltransferase MocA
MEAVDPEGKYKTKALLPFLGKRLVDWQLEALRQSPYIEGLYLLGISQEDAKFDFPVHYVPCETVSEFGDKLIRGLAYLEEEGKTPDTVIISSCDAPGIRVGEINQFFEAIEADPGKEVYISLVPEEVGEAVFPKSGRVVARFKDFKVFPGELMALSPKAIRMQKTVIDELGLQRRKINRKKSKISLGPMLSYLAKRPSVWPLLIKFGLGKATLADGERGISKTFSTDIKGIIISEAGFGMDMDLPEDYARLEDYVRRVKLAGK